MPSATARLRQLGADVPEADHAERLPAKLDPGEGAALPAARPKGGVGPGNLPGEREHQRERVLGGRRVHRHRRVDDDHALPSRRVDVDVVDADASAADHPQVGRRLDHLRRHLRLAPDDEAGVAGDHLGERGGREAGANVDVEVRLE